MDFNQKSLQYSLIVRGQTPIVLVTDPSGWQNTLISVKRSPNYYGTIRNFTVPIDFVKEGATILRSEYYTFGIQADVQIQVSLFNPDTWNYDVKFTGRLDFSNCKDTGYSDGYKFTVNVMQADISALVAAYENTVFDIPFPQTPVLINLPGIILQEIATYNLNMGGNSRNVLFFPQMDIAENNIVATKPSSRSVTFDKQASPLWNNNGDFFYGPTVNNTLNIQGGLHFSITGGGTFSIDIRDNTGASVANLYTVTKPNRAEIDLDIGFNKNIPVTVGNSYHLYFSWTNSGQPFNNGDGFYLETSNMISTYSTSSPATQVKAMRLYDLYNALIQKMWNLGFPGALPYPVQSLLLSQTWKTLCVTSGNAIRPDQNSASFYNAGDQLTAGLYYTVVNNPYGSGGTVTYNGNVYNIGDVFLCLPTALFFTATGFAEVSTVTNPSVIKTSFKDFFQSINSVMNAGFGDLNGTATLENKGYFYNSYLKTEDVQDIKSFELTPYTDYIYNSIKGGYPDQTYDVVNGKKEINSSVQYSTPVTKVQKELNIQSVYRADPYGIEFLRILLGNNVSNGDNSVFFIKVKPNTETGQAYYNPEGVEAFSSVSGVSSGVFNLAISPKQNLLRHASFLAGSLNKVQGAIKLASATKSTDLSTISLSGVNVSEKADVDISALGTPMFLPMLASVTSDAPNDLTTNLANFPTGYFNFNKDGNNFTGFIIDAGSDPAQNKEQTRGLLLSPLNDITKLID